MIFITITAMIIYFVALAWTWQSLGNIEKNKKVIFLLIGLLIMYIITLIVFQTTKNKVMFENMQMQKDIQNIIVIIFTGINTVVALPQIGKTLDKINEEQIKKDELKKRIIILSIIFIICLVFESGYMKNIQEGIINIYNAKKG